MSLPGVLAGLLLAGPAHGYQLQATLEGELGPLWRTRASQVYLTLGRMQRDGLISARRVRQATRPDRQMFELTARGREHARAWLDGPGDDDELAVRLAVARLAGEETFAGIADAALAQRTAALRALRALRGEVDEGFQREAVDAEVFRTQAELRWLDGVRTRAAEIAAVPRGTRRRGRNADDRSA
jgi:DNA-binding PadR family transcriptional regulator